MNAEELTSKLMVKLGEKGSIGTKEWESIKFECKDLEESLVARIDHLIKTKTTIPGDGFVESEDKIINHMGGDDRGTVVYRVLTKTE